MRPPRYWICPLVSAAMLLALPAQAATVQPSAAQATIDALARANASVVGVRVTVAQGARSAETDRKSVV